MFSNVNYGEYVNMYELFVYELDVIFEELGYIHRESIYYHFYIPSGCIGDSYH